MVDSESLRHSRHALLNGFDEDGVAIVQNARALVIGAGGLGCPAATYLVSSGIQTLHWVDGDTVDATNLARQPLFSPQDIGMSKVVCGTKALRHIHPNCSIIASNVYADESLLDESVPLADVVLDCTDQWATRQMINASCVRHNVPLISAAAIEWTGQLLSINPHDATHACYACLFDPAHEPAAHACGAYGVLSPMVGAMGCLQAAEALKMLLIRAGHLDAAATPQMLSILDMKSGRWQQLSVTKNPDCPVCAGRALTAR